MNHFSEKVNYIIERLSSQVNARIEVKEFTNRESIKLNCISCSYSLTAVACVVSLTLLITSECREPIAGCLVVKVLSQIYRIIFSIILPQIFVVYLLSFLIIKNQGTLSIKKIITNLFFLTCLDMPFMVSIVCLANYNKEVFNVFVFIISILCPLVAQFLSYLTLKYLEKEQIK